MKNLLIIVGFCCAICSFLACSNDETNEGGNEASEKKLVKMKVTATGESEDQNGIWNDTITYDLQARPTQIGDYKAIYSNNQVEIIDMKDPEDTDTTIYILKNGQAEKRLKDISYSYDANGHLAYVTTPSYVEGVYDTTTFVMENGNTQKILTKYGTFTFNYAKPIPNNTTVDLYGIVIAVEEWTFKPRQFNIGGKKSKQLPTSIDYKSKNSNEIETTTYIYEVRDNVIVKITETMTNEEGEAIYELFYE